jgi:hypothetical protein
MNIDDFLIDMASKMTWIKETTAVVKGRAGSPYRKRKWKETLTSLLLLL